MASTLFAVVALVLLVLPGFVTSRLAMGRRPSPAGLGDLELILRAIAYALVLHGTFALLGWTARIVNDADHSGEWEHHVPALVLYGAAVLGAAVALGATLNIAFDALQPHVAASRAAQWVFAVLGGDDVRDGFDYIFTRRKQSRKPFIVLVRTDGPGGQATHVGRYGDRSYVGISPRPHDLYLEEMWENTPEGPRRGAGPAEGAWFAAGSIKDLHFRDLPAEDERSGHTQRLGRTGIEEAIRQQRHRLADEVAGAARVMAPEGTDAEQVRGDFEDARDRVIRLLREQPGEDASPGDHYNYWTGRGRTELLELAGLGTALAALEREVPKLPGQFIAGAMGTGRLWLRLRMHPPEPWIAILEDRSAQLLKSGWSYDEFIALVTSALEEIDDTEWDFDDELAS